MRLKPEWKRGLSQNRLLILSIFGSKVRQPTVDLARERNTFAAALADKIFVAHAAEGSKTLEFSKTVSEWGKPIFTFDTEANRSLLQVGAQRLESP